MKILVIEPTELNFSCLVTEENQSDFTYKDGYWIIRLVKNPNN